MKKITINGKMLNYIIGGEGETILFLHGILADARTWKPHCDLLSTRYHTVAYTQSGFGAENSDTLSSEFNTSIHADELLEFCHKLNLNNITLVAWSYSCHIALLAALKRPELFKHLHLYDLIVPSYGISVEDKRIFTRDITQMMSPIIKSIRNQDLIQATDQFISSCSNNTLTLKKQSSTLQSIKKDNLHTLPLLLAQQTPPEISAELLASLSLPISIYWGEQSRAIFKRASHTAFMQIAQKDPFSGEIKNRHHLWPEEDPKGFIEMLFPHCP